MLVFDMITSEIDW